MADKEERQKRPLIKEYDSVCDSTDCEYCEEKDWCSEKNNITRQEAIERMAKALKKVIYILSEEACIEGCEAALNALLEDKLANLKDCPCIMEVQK